MAGWWFSLGTPVSSNNKTDCHDIITEILLKVALNTRTLNPWISNTSDGDWSGLCCVWLYYQPFTSKKGIWM